MKYQHYQVDDIIVAIRDSADINSLGNIIYQGDVRKVNLSGAYESKGHEWVVRLAGTPSQNYFPSYDFRYATTEEASRYTLLGKYKVAEPKFGTGNRLKALSDVTTVDGEYTIEAEEERVVIDCIVNRKKLEDSIFWFDNHPGVFRMSDNFELIKE